MEPVASAKVSRNRSSLSSTKVSRSSEDNAASDDVEEPVSKKSETSQSTKFVEMDTQDPNLVKSSSSSVNSRKRRYSNVESSIKSDFHSNHNSSEVSKGDKNKMASENTSSQKNDSISSTVSNPNTSMLASEVLVEASPVKISVSRPSRGKKLKLSESPSNPDLQDQLVSETFSIPSTDKITQSSVETSVLSPVNAKASSSQKPSSPTKTKPSLRSDTINMNIPSLPLVDISVSSSKPESSHLLAGNSRSLYPRNSDNSTLQESPRIEESPYLLRNKTDHNIRIYPRIGPDYQADIPAFTPMNDTDRDSPVSISKPGTRSDVNDIENCTKIWDSSAMKETDLLSYLLAINECIKDMKSNYVKREHFGSTQPVANGSIFVNGSYVLVRSRAEEMIYDVLNTA
jgi:hypothetical protein